MTTLTKIEKKIRIYCEGLKATYATASIKLSQKVWMASLSIQSDAMRKKKRVWIFLLGNFQKCFWNSGYHIPGNGQFQLIEDQFNLTQFNLGYFPCNFT